MKSKYRKGMHLIAKYEGTGGDLIVGLITSVRMDGTIVGTNLLTGARFNKDTDVIDKRNIVCSKATAVAVVKAADGDKKVAREEAITYARLLMGKGEAKAPPKPKSEKKIQRAISVLKKLDHQEKQLVLKGIFPDISKAFGEE